MKLFRWFFVIIISFSVGCTTFGGYLVTGEDPFILTVSTTNNFNPAIRKWILKHRNEKGNWTYTKGDDTYLLVSRGKGSTTQIGRPAIRRNEETEEFNVTIQLHQSDNKNDNDHYYKLFLIQPSVSDAKLNVSFEELDDHSEKDSNPAESDTTP